MVDAALAVGSRVGEYEVEAAIGRGGFGTVYRAVQPLIGKRVAIKVLARRFSGDPEIVSRFQAEAKTVNQIRHHNIIDIFSFGQLDDGRSYYVMDLLEGEPLDRRIANGPMPLGEALPILRALARALDAAHQHGIAHRDLKPENVFLARDGDGVEHPKLLDFGIAKLLTPEPDVVHRTGTGVPLGTPYYMSPEQCRGRDVNERTDVYSFGVMTYRMLTGRYPFEGDFMELMMAHVNTEPPPPSSHVPALPLSLDSAIAWMMRKDRAQRPATLAEAVAALDPDAPVTPPPLRSSRPSIPPRTSNAALALAETVAPSPVRRRRWPLVVGGLAVVACAVAWWFAPSSPLPAATPPSSTSPIATTPQQPPPPTMPAVVGLPSAPPPPTTTTTTPPVVATPLTPHAISAHKKRVPSGSAAPSSPDGDAKPGDIIHLPAETFRPSQ